MKKLVSTFLSLFCVIDVACSFVGCGDQLDEGEPEGKLYRLGYALEMGWIDEFDLKSIACGYYELLNIEDNPYSGLWKEPTDKLSEDTENKIKYEFFGRTEGITIPKYYGNYDGNIAVTLGFEDQNYDGIEAKDISFNGINFPKFELYSIRIYHYTEKSDPSIILNSRLLSLKRAYEMDILDENDLKSIACCFNERNKDVENPYVGLYEPPTQKLSKEIKTELKQAYLKQIDEMTGEVLDGIKIHKYYGTYKGHVVVSMSGYSCGLPVSTEGTEIGGVVFNSYGWAGIYVYKVQ